MNKPAIIYAVLAALCYGVSAPVSKLLLQELPPTLLAALLYLGAGLGMVLVNLFGRKGRKNQEASITRKEFPYVAGMILLDIAAPILLLWGLTLTTPATAALLNHFEIAATSIIALLFFKEAIGRRMWFSIALITAASILLSVEELSSLSLSAGAGLVLLASICWGLENNCTRMLSLKDPLQIVVIKGLGAGSGSLILALCLGERTLHIGSVAAALLLGFVAYGLSIYFYIVAQRDLGASRTSAYYAFAPFVGVGLSLLIFLQPPSLSFLPAFFLMTLGAFSAAYEQHSHRHTHQPLTHEHRHSHGDQHHNHAHGHPVQGQHSHLHTHSALCHKHPHTPRPAPHP